MKTKVLVTGGAGYIGGITVDLLKDNGYDPIVYDYLVYEDRFLKDVDFVFGDIRDTKHLCEAARDCDTVIHLAALVGDPACEVDKDLAEEMNHLAVERMCEALPRDKHIIYMSTCSVYGHQDDILDENGETAPISTYGKTKLKAENHILERGGTVFRLGTIFGLGDRYSRLRFDLVVNYLTLLAIEDGQFTVTSGDQWRPIISVGDVGQYLVEATSLKPPGVFNVSWKNYKVSEMGQEIAGLIPGTEIFYKEGLYEDRRNYKVSTEKLFQTFKHRPTDTIETEVHKLAKVITDRRIYSPRQNVFHNGNYLIELKKKVDELLSFRSSKDLQYWKRHYL